MQSENSFFHKLLVRLSSIGKGMMSRVSKLFDRVVYSSRASLYVSGLMALVICLVINYQDLDFQFFKGNMQTMNLAAVPVEVLGDENTYEVSGVPSVVDISIEGDPADIQLVKTQNTAAVTVDLRNMQEGTVTIPLEAVGLPSSVKAEITPATVDATLTKKYAKTFFLTPDLIVGTGQSSSAYETPVLSVRSVTVKATRAKLDSIRTIRAIVDTSGYEGSFKASVPLVAYDSSGKQINVAISPETVEATVTLKGQEQSED